jgi:hypothetical protein
MCLVIIRKTREAAEKLHANPHIAKKDIIVYKVLDTYKRKGETKYRSPYMRFKWMKGQHYFERGGTLGTSYIGQTWDGKYEFDVSEGLHAYTTPKRAFSGSYVGAVVVEMVVPKGAKYYTSSIGEIVATEMIFHEDAIILENVAFGRKHNLIAPPKKK